MKFNFNFTEEPLTKGYLLSRFSQEQYMSWYLHQPITRKLFCSPLRTDRNPTCGFFRSSGGDLLFHDFATGQSLDFIGVVREMYRLDYKDALKQIASDFSLGNEEVHNTVHVKVTLPKIREHADIRVKIKDFTDDELAWWKSFGISKETLERYRVYSCDNVFLNGNLFTSGSRLTFGYFGGCGKNNEFWRIYYPGRRFRFLTNWPSTMVQGMNMLPESGKLLVITKSMKDVMSMSEFGINAIAPNSETQFVTDKVLDNLKKRFKYIVVFYDNDRPGKLSMWKLRKLHPELRYFFIPKGYAKDFTDTYKLIGRNTMKKLIKKALIFILTNGKTIESESKNNVSGQNSVSIRLSSAS